MKIVRLSLLSVALGCSTEPTCEPDCSAGYVCQVNQCVPVAEACIPDCSAGYVCEVGQCVPQGASQIPSSQTPLSADPKVATEIVNLGMVVSGQEFEVQVPAGLVSFQLDAIGTTTAMTAFLSGRGPNGEVLFDHASQPAERDRRVIPNDGIASLRFPFTPDVLPAAGSYRFVVASNSPNESYTLRATWVRQVGTTLDVNFIFVGVPGLDASSAQQQPQFQTALATFKQIYASAGISVRDVQYYDVGGEVSNRLAIVDSDAELSELFWLASGVSQNDHLNFYFVRAIQLGGEVVILGIAGGIPGVASDPNGAKRGVAVTSGDLAQDPQGVALTMAHEGGHYLGLRHPSERTGTMHDLLQDTAECGAERDVNRDGTVDYSECGGAGANNLMFWSSGLRGAPEISTHQAAMIRSGAIVR